MNELDHCRRICELLPEYTAGRISPRERAAVVAHLESCAECRDRAAAVKLLQQTPVPIPDPERWDGFVEDVVEAAARSRGSRRGWAWGVAAAAVLAVATSLLLRAPSPEGGVGGIAGLEALAREVAGLPDSEAAVWTVGVDPVDDLPPALDGELSEEELQELVREAGRT